MNLEYYDLGITSRDATDGDMAKDLALLIGPDAPFRTTEEFLSTLAANLRKALA